MLKPKQTKAEKYYPQVKNVIFSLMSKYGVNDQNREDLYQSAYLGYLKALKTYKKGKSSIVTWCYYSIRKELQEYCKSYYQTSGFSKHRTKVMPKEIIVYNDCVEQITYQDPLQNLIDKECEEELKNLKTKPFQNNETKPKSNPAKTPPANPKLT